jgi:hypothetical protein
MLLGGFVKISILRFPVSVVRRSFLGNRVRRRGLTLFVAGRLRVDLMSDKVVVLV